MIVAIVTRSDRLHLMPEGGDIEELLPGQSWFGWPFEDLFALGTGEHTLAIRNPIEPGIDIVIDDE